MNHGRLLTLFACLFAFAAEPAWARNAVVTTLDGKSYEGDVEEKGEVVIITVKGGTKMTFKKGFIEKIEDAASTEDQFKQKLAKLPKNDAPARITLAQWALDREEYDLALEALDEAIVIDPNNEDARVMQKTVINRKRVGRAPADPNAAAGAKNGTATPAPNGARPAAGAAKPAPAAAEDETMPAETQAPSRAASGEGKKLRLVTPEEVNRIRQMELQKNETVTVRLQNDVKRRYLASSEFTPQEFNKMTPLQQGYEIINNGSSRLRNDVIIVNDPASMATFKSAVQRPVLAGCATASCHGGPKGGDFTLHNPAAKDTDTYTNFLLMQDYKTTIDGKEFALIDRARPDESLLLYFGMALRDSNIPHPEVQNFRPIFKGRNDPRYQAVLNWMNQMAPVQPEYGIDLTKEPGEGDSTTRPSRDRDAAAEDNAGAAPPAERRNGGVRTR